MQKENIEAILKDYQCPYMGTDLVSGNTVKEIKVEGKNVSIKVFLALEIRQQTFESVAIRGHEFSQ